MTLRHRGRLRCAAMFERIAAALAIAALAACSRDMRIDGHPILRADPPASAESSAVLLFSDVNEGQLQLQNSRLSRLAVDIAGGRAVVAPGSYRIVGLVARERDASGIEWEAACDSRGDIDAQAGAEIAVTAGPPLFSAIHASPVGHGLIALEFELTDSSGGECQLLRAGRRPEPPGFEVQNAAGEIVAAGRFEYG